MQRWWRIGLVLLVLALAGRSWLTPGPSVDAVGAQPEAPAHAGSPDHGIGRAEAPSAAWLPTEARDTLRLIESGGPFPYDRDGTVFQNRERLLPPRPPGHYREYTVTTPGSRDRGARRIVTGGEPPVEFYYTDDHYRSFRRIEVDQQ